jgi:hypothetical protein
MKTLKFFFYSQFRSLTLGYQNTSGNATLKACHEYLVQQMSLYPGEGEAVLDMLQEVLSFMNYTGENEEFLASAQAFYQIINILLERNYSVVNSKVCNIQTLAVVELHVTSSVISLVGFHTQALLAVHSAFVEHLFSCLI